KVRARRDATVAALAAMRFRADRGHLPTTLEELTPTYLGEVPRDPFARAPLRYRVEADGFVVYSVGEDGTDDGGRERDDHGSELRDGTDIPFTVGGGQERLWPAAKGES